MRFHVESCEFESVKRDHQVTSVDGYTSPPIQDTRIRLVLTFDAATGDTETEMIANAVTKWRRERECQVKP